MNSKDPRDLSRRHLLKGVSSMAALSALGGSAKATQAEATKASPSKRALEKGAVILFQGDSITDAGRAKGKEGKKAEKQHKAKALGKGYPAMAAGELLGAYPDRDLTIYNRGISGNKVPDLAKRWQRDTIDLKPDILSILVGVNDLWHTFAFGSKYKGTIKDYKTGYRDLIERSREQIPGVQIVICEPFTLRDSDHFKPLADYRAVAKQLAQENNLPFVPFQSMFDEATQAAPADFWLWDGVHPTPPGHALMVQKWREVVGV
jgi:lysophospholipase L1-like esterase